MNETKEISYKIHYKSTYNDGAIVSWVFVSDADMRIGWDKNNASAVDEVLRLREKWGDDHCFRLQKHETTITDIEL